jgi:hypothetical protein
MLGEKIIDTLSEALAGGRPKICVNLQWSPGTLPEGGN